jgi:ADP-ribosylglycohydrolase
MLGAIAGDIIGSVYENFHTKRKDFRLFTPISTFTDDTVLTVAVADAILTGSGYGSTIKSYARRWPMRGYGPGFMRWMLSPDINPYNSFGNGSAMRVSPVAHAFSSLSEVLEHAKLSAECTHNHPEGIKGAQATALAVYLARHGSYKDDIRSAVEEQTGYDLSRSVDSIRPGYSMDITCQGSVPESIIAFLDSTSFEDAVRNAVSLGGDADTQACIAGSIAEAYYKEIPLEILRQIRKKMDTDLWEKTMEFYGRFGIGEINGQLRSLDNE